MNAIKRNLLLIVLFAISACQSNNRSLERKPSLKQSRVLGDSIVLGLQRYMSRTECYKYLNQCTRDSIFNITQITNSYYLTLSNIEFEIALGFMNDTLSQVQFYHSSKLSIEDYTRISQKLCAKYYNSTIKKQRHVFHELDASTNKSYPILNESFQQKWSTKNVNIEFVTYGNSLVNANDLFLINFNQNRATKITYLDKEILRMQIERSRLQEKERLRKLKENETGDLEKL